MPRNCIACSHPQRPALDAELVAGARMADVSRAFDVSVSALNRHKQNHLTTILRSLVASDTFQTTDLIERLAASLNDLSAIRAQALASGNSASVIRAAAVSNSLISTLLDRMGIDDLSVAQELVTANKIFEATARAMRREPAFGLLLAEQLKYVGVHDEAHAIETTSRQLIRERADREIQK